MTHVEIDPANFDVQAFFREQATWLVNTRKKRDEERKLRADETLKACTFAPKIGKYRGRRGAPSSKRKTQKKETIDMKTGKKKKFAADDADAKP